MPQGKISLDSILGLTTQRDDTSGINSPQWSSMAAWAVENSSSGATPPNSLTDCSNIIISRNKQAAARTSFVEVWDFTSTYGSDTTFQTTGLYSIPNTSPNSNSIQFAWINSSSANIANFSTSTDQKMTSTVFELGGIESNIFISKGHLLPDFSWNSAEFYVRSFNLAYFSTSYSNIYIFSSNGLFRTTLPYKPNITAVSYNKYKRVTLPLVLSVSAQITNAPPLPTDASRWFPSGYLVDLKVVVTDQLSGTQVYQGKPSRTITIANTGTVSSIQITFSVDNTNLLLDSGGVAVYRTISYLPQTPSPEQFFKCYEASLASGTTVSSVTTFTNIELTLNDTSIQGFEQIYTSLDRESGSAVSAESSAPPTARCIANYNNFTVYGNVMSPPFAPLTMIALPNTDGLDLLTVGKTTVNITYTQNSIVPPDNTGIIDAVSGTFKGVDSSPNSGKGYNVVIRPQDPTVATASATPASYCVPYYATAFKLSLAAGGSGSTQNINITPLDAAVFDITKFPTTGIIAVIKSNTTGYVVALFSYQSYTQTVASGYYTFSNCLAYGVPFTDQTWTASGGDGLPTNGAYILYSIPTTSITTIPVYAIGSSPVGYSDQIGFSLLPTYDIYPTRPFNQEFVGFITSVTQTMASTALAPFAPVTASISFSGIYALNSGQLLDSCVRTLCDTYNVAKNQQDPYAVYDDSSTAPVGRIRFESIYSGYNRQSDYTTNALYTSGTGFYDQITAKISRADVATPTVKFAEPIAVNATQTNIMQQSVQTMAGLTISKSNKPEEIPIGQNLTPLIIGDPLKPIIHLENQYNQLLVFKQNEGTYRVDMQGTGTSGVLPFVNILSLIDNSAWLLLPQSVQIFEGTVIYFSNKAFVTISPSGQLGPMSPTIATEVLNAYSIIFDNGDVDKVRSWVIPQQRLYCCYFPFINTDSTSSTYVFSFETGQWTKWSGEIADITVSATGLISLVENIYSFTTAIQTTNQLNHGDINPTSKYWSVLRQANFQTTSQTQVEDTIPLTGFTLIPDAQDVYYNLVITNFTSASVYKNLYDLLSLYKNRTIWYLSQTIGYLSTVLVKTVPGVSITLQFVNNTYEQLPIVPDFTPTTSDFLITTVNTALFFNKFFIATPRGSTLSHFSEVQLYTQEGETYTNLALGFNSLAKIDQYIYTTTGNIIITTTGAFVVLDQNTYDIFGPYYVLASSVYVFRALIPRESGRGRFIQIAVLHDTPNEILKINSIVYLYRDTNSTKIKAHS